MSQIICPISGEVLYKSDLFLGFDLQDFHPIFRAKKELILTPDIIWKFQAAKSLREKKMYYLAVLNTMGLVDFRHPANPAPYVVEHTFIDVCTLATWVDYAKFQIRDKIQFPRYAVTPENRELKEISIWISSLYDIRNLFLEKSKLEDLKKDLNAKAAEIEREFKRAGALGRAFTPPLAKWALELAEVESGVFEKWRGILCTPLEDAWTLQKEDIEEILDHLRSELPINNDQVIAVISQAKLLWRQSRAGFVEFVNEDGDPDEPTSMTDSKHKPKHPPMLNGGEAAPLISMADVGPEPLKHQFPKFYLYLQAKARWDLLRREASGERKGEYGQF